jgi:hypothetical protein
MKKCKAAIKGCHPDGWPAGRPMKIKEATKIIISLSKPEKMPGYAYGLPAWECKTGAKLALVPGSVCAGCYAMKGNYARFPEIKKSQYKRLAAIRHPLWVRAMAAKINSVAVSKHKFFRWHDAGDVQDLRHLAKIFEVCRRTPDIQHWMPTREAWTKRWIERAPSNLVIRFSGTMIDQPAVKSWPNTSTVTTTPGSRTCSAPDNGGQCGSCRACWNPEIKNIAYGKH